MSQARLVAGNTGIFLAGRFINLFLKIWVFLLIGRYLPEADYGRYTFLMSLAVIVCDIPNLRLPTIIVREASRQPDRLEDLITQTIVMRLMMAAGTYIILHIALKLLGYDLPLRQAAMVITLWFFVEAIETTFIAGFQARLNVFPIVLGDVGKAVISLAGAALGVWLGKGLIWFVALIPVASVGTVIIQLCLGAARWKYSLKRGFSDAGFLLREAMPLGLAALLGTIYFRFNTLILESMRGELAVSYFGIAYKFFDISLMIPQALIISLYPLMSMTFTVDPDKFRRLVRKSLQLSMIIAIPWALGITAWGDDVLILMFGDKFLNSIPVLKVLIWAAALAFPGHIFGNALIAMNRQGLMACLTGAGVVINVALSLYLIPRVGEFGAKGAAEATLITEIAVILAYIVLLGSLCRGCISLGIFLRPILAGVLPGLFLLYFPGLNLMIQVILCLILYPVGLVVTGAFKAEDRRVLKEIFMKNRS